MASKKRLHIVFLPFSCVGLGLASLDPGWMARRAEIFRRYTLQSLKNQKKHDFIVWMAFRRQDAMHPVTHELSAMLDKAKIKHVFTYDGLPYWDDKFTPGAFNRVLNALRVVRHAWRRRSPSGAFYGFTRLFQDVNGSLEDRVSRMVRKIHDRFGHADEVLLTRLDSDDLLRVDALQLFSKHKERWIIPINGYILKTQTHEVAEWNPEKTPPFFSLRFDGNEFFNPERYLDVWGGYRSHEDAGNHGTVSYIKDRVYLVGIHEAKDHISTQWEHPFRGKLVEDRANKALLRAFGVFSKC